MSAQIETKEQAYDEMMQALINISGHSHLIQGWCDMLYPIRHYVAQYDPTLMPKMVETMGRLKILNKQISKTFVKDDEKSKDVMYEQIGKGISNMSNLSYSDAMSYLDELNQLADKYK
jgi:hypothetical protein